MGKELVTRSQKQATIFDLVQKQSPAFQMALGKNIDPDRFVRVAMTTIRTNPKLQECKPASILASLMHCAQLSLEPGPLGHAYLVPFGKECTLIPGYQGLIELAHRSGKVLNIYAECVHENDHFLQVLGTDRRIEHTPPKFGEKRGDIIGVYAVAKLAGGADPQFVVLTQADVEFYRSKSRGRDSMAWKDHWDAMAKKTAVRQLAKWIPKSTDMDRAIELEEAAEKGQDQASFLDASVAFHEADEAPTEIVENEPTKRSNGNGSPTRKPSEMDEPPPEHWEG